MPILFGGTDEIVSVDDNATLDFGSGNFSCAVWFKHNTLGAAQIGTFVTKYDITRGFFTELRQSSGGAISWQVWTNGSANRRVRTSAATGLDDGAWHHATFVYSGDLPDIYIDGALSNGATVSSGVMGNINNAVSLFIGSLRDVASYWDGTIGEIAFWNTDLSAIQAALLCDSRVKRIPLQVAPANLVAYWPMDDKPHGTNANGDTVLDISSNTNNGTGDDGAGNVLTWQAEEVLSYPTYIMTPQSIAAAAAPVELIAIRGPFRGINRGIQRGVA